MAVTALLVSHAALAREVYTDTSDVHACVMRDGATIAATDGGVVVSQGGTRRVLTALDGLPDTRADAVLSTGDGLWVGTDHGAVLLGDGFTPKRTALDGSVRALVLWKGDVMAGSFGGGIADLTRGTSLVIPDARVLSLSTSHGVLEVGTMGGLYRQSNVGFNSVSSLPAFGAPAQCTAASNGLPSNDVSAIAADAHTLWVGTFDHGVARLDQGRFRVVRGVDPRIDALALDRAATRLWVGTARGLYAVDDDTGHLVLGSDEVHALTALEGGGVLAGTSHGAVIVRGDVVTRIGAKEGVNVPSVTAVLAQGETLLLGTTGGLFIGSGQHFERLSVASGHLPDDWVTALAARGSTLYAGTYNAGVVKLERTPAGFHAERLGGGYVNPAGLTMTGGTLDVSTMDGLLVSTQGGRLERRDGVALGRDVTGVAVSAFGTFVASRRGVTKIL